MVASRPKLRSNLVNHTAAVGSAAEVPSHRSGPVDIARCVTKQAIRGTAAVRPTGEGMDQGHVICWVDLEDPSDIAAFAHPRDDEDIIVGVDREPNRIGSFGSICRERVEDV